MFDPSSIHRRPTLLALWCLLALTAAACSYDAGGGGGTDGWIIGDDAGPDTSAQCGNLRSQTSCTGADGCFWWSSPCTSGRCYPDGTKPPKPECQPVECRNIHTENTCDNTSRCSWFERTCPDGSTAGGCYAPGAKRPVPKCPNSDTCNNRVPDRCEVEQCSLATPGCGENPPAFSGKTCLPDGTCEDTSDCAEDYKCMMLSLAVDCGQCDACGAGQKKCVPENWSKDRPCRQLDRDACGQTSRCSMVWPGCNEEAPDGTKTVEEPTCMPVRSCARDGRCAGEGFECTSIWAGCPPDALCAACGSEQKRCLRTD